MPGADKIVEVPGVGNVSFPSGMSDDYISQVIQGHIAQQNSVIDKMQSDAQGGGFFSGAKQYVTDAAKGIGQQFSPSNLKGAFFANDEEQQAEERLRENQQQQSEQKAGYSKTYQNVAKVAPLIGVNPPAMEDAAKKGQAGTILGQAAVPAALAVAPTAYEAGKSALPKINEAAGAAADAIKNVHAPESVANAASKLASVTPVAKMFIDGPPEQLLTQAIKPGKNNVDWTPSLKTAIPNMKLAEQAMGKPIQGIDDALQAAQVAKKQLWNQYAPRLQAADAAGAVIDGNQIADAMVNSIDKRTAIQNPGLVEKVKAVADTYRKPIPVTEAEDFLVSANRDLNSYYAKNKVGRRVAEGDPSVSSTVAEADALRDGLYSKLDEINGPGSADFKKQYGALTNVEKELQGRKNVSERQQPVSLAEQLSTARAYGKIAKGMLTLSPGDVLEGSESVAVAKWLKERQTSDAMITRAFEAAKKPEPPAFGLTPPPGPAPAGPQQLGLPGATTPLESNFSPQGRRDAAFAIPTKGPITGFQGGGLRNPPPKPLPSEPNFSPSGGVNSSFAAGRPKLSNGWKYDSFGRPVRIQ